MAYNDNDLEYVNDGFYDNEKNDVDDDLKDNDHFNCWSEQGRP